MYPEISIVVPVFNSELILRGHTERIVRALSGKHRIEIIYVDDGSRDDSWQVIVSLADMHTFIAGVRLGRNVGQYAATFIGLQHVRAPVSVILDDDLQHPPESIPLLLDALTPDIDLVYGAPRQSVQKSSYRVLVAIIKYLLAVVSGAPFLRHLRSFRVLRTSIYPWASTEVTPYITPDGVLKSARPRTSVVVVDYADREIGQSSYTLGRSLRLALSIWRSTHIKKRPVKASDEGGISCIAEKTGWLLSGDKNHIYNK